MNNWREAAYVVSYGLSLTLFMATGLFISTGLNPKSESFGYLPWLYAGLSFVGGLICYIVSGNYLKAARRE